MNRRVGDDANNGRHVRGGRPVITMAFTLMLSICTSCIMRVSGDTAGVTGHATSPTGSIASTWTALTPGPTTPNPTTPNPTIPNLTTPKPTIPIQPIPNPTTPNPTIPNPTTPNLTTPKPTIPIQPIHNPTTPNPTTPNPTIPNPTIHNRIIPNPTTPNPTTPTGANSSTETTHPSVILQTATLPSTVGKTSITSLVTTVGKTTAVIPTITGSSKKPTLPQDIPSTPDNEQTPRKTISPAGYVVETGIPASTARTAHVSTAGTKNQTQVGTTSGSEGALTTAPPTSIVYETVLVTEPRDAVDRATGNVTVRYVTSNATTTPVAGDPGLDPDHEKDELKKLLLIIGCSIGVAVVAILISFTIVYSVAKRRNKRKNSRYYNFKKKKTNYEKVLHLQEYHGDVGTDTGAGTGAAWVFDENETNKAITLEMTPKGKDKQDSRSGKSKKSRNKNKNNRNKSAGRGNYQVLAEFFPTSSRTTPPDAFLTEEGAVYSNSIDNGEGAVLDTSFAPLMVDEKAESVETDGLSSKDSSLGDSMRLSWPAWNTSPYVTITQEDTGVEL